MPKAAPFLASSNAGEFSPLMDARVDFDKYASGISRGLNLICLPQGGLTKCPGTRFIKEVKDSGQAAWLVPFQASTSSSYQTEWGAQSLRFYRNQGSVSAQTVSATIVNGTFATNISGWTNLSTGSASTSWSSGRMAVIGAADGTAWTQQQIAISQVGTAHVIQFTLTGNPASVATIQIGTSTGAYDILRYTGVGMGNHTVGFIPAGANVYFQVLNESADTFYLDNVAIVSNQPVELVTPYAAADVSGLRWAQSADVMYILHDKYAPQKLERRGDLSWSLSKVFFADGPYLGINPQTDLAKSNLLRNSRFDGGISNWSQVGTGNGYVNYNSSSRVVLFQSATTSASTAGVDQAVTTTASGGTHVIHFQIVGGGTVQASIGTTSGASDILNIGNLAAGWYSASFIPGVTTFHVSFIQTLGSTVIAGGISAAFLYNTQSRLLQPNGTSGAIIITALGDFRPFASTDVGRSIRFEYPGREPGWGVITGYIDAQNVNVLLYRNLPAAVALESWRLGSWSDTTDWPHTGTFYQQRLFLCRNSKQPQTVWASQSADFENMRPDSWVEGATTTQDDDALNFTIATRESNPICWIVGTRKLVVGTGTGQWALTSRGAALTPSDFSADPQTSIKALDIDAITIDNLGIFAQRAKRALYDLGYQFATDSFNGSDLTILAYHITQGQIAQIVYQAEPYSNVWARMEDGTLACLTYKRNQNVVGWTPVVLGGSAATAAVVEAMSVIPGAAVSSGQVYSSVTRDELWLIVRRTINSVSKRYIEVMEGIFDGPNIAAYTNRDTWRSAMRTAQADAFYVDCGLTYKGTPVISVSGLGHLEGETVVVLADGAVQSSKIVSGGTITLDLAASTVHVGLAYDWLYRSLKLPYGSPTGPGVGQKKEPYETVLALRDSPAFSYAYDLPGEGDEVDGDLVFKQQPFRRAVDPMGKAVPLFTGEVRLDIGEGINTDPRLVLRGDSQPLPFTLLGISPRLEETEL